MWTICHTSTTHLVPRLPVRVTVPDDLRALREAVEVVASTGNGTANNAERGLVYGFVVLGEPLFCATSLQLTRRWGRL